MGLLKSGGLGSGTEVREVGMCNGELGFEVLPGLIGGSGAAPFATGFVEHLGPKHEGVCIVNDLPGGVRVATSVGVVLSIFDLLDEDFEWLGRVVGGLEALVVGIEVHGGDSAIGAVEVREYLDGGYVGVRGVSVFECPDVNIWYSSKKELFQRVVDGVVVAKHAEFGGMLADVGRNLGGGSIG